MCVCVCVCGVSCVCGKGHGKRDALENTADIWRPHKRASYRKEDKMNMR